MACVFAGSVIGVFFVHKLLFCGALLLRPCCNLACCPPIWFGVGAAEMSPFATTSSRTTSGNTPTRRSCASWRADPARQVPLSLPLCLIWGMYLGCPVSGLVRVHVRAGASSQYIGVCHREEIVGAGGVLSTTGAAGSVAGTGRNGPERAGPVVDAVRAAWDDSLADAVRRARTWRPGCMHARMRTRARVEAKRRVLPRAARSSLPSRPVTSRLARERHIWFGASFAPRRRAL